MIPKVEKVNLNEIIGQLIEVYGNHFLFAIGSFIILIFVLMMIHKFIKSKGFMKSPLEQSLEKIGKGMIDIKDFLYQNATSNKEMTQKILSNQEFKLSDEQINVILKDKEYIYVQEFMELCVDVYIKNHIRDYPQKTIDKLRSSCKAIVIKEDKDFDILPTVKPHIISTRRKIQELNDHKIPERMYDVMIEQKNTEDFIRNCKTMIQNFITTYWFIKE